MEPFDCLVLAWLALSLGPFVLGLTLGPLVLWAGNRSLQKHPPPERLAPVAVLLPLKGVSRSLPQVLLSMVRQNHPDFEVVLILESQDDEANGLVDDLCREHGHCRKVISGLSATCAQKNYGLIAGIESLNPRTEILVFCDSSNLARPDWLAAMTRPIDMNRFDVVTTFRVFRPDPPTIPGVCQAVYAACLTALQAFFTTPWGGGTAIRRSTFESLNIAELWSETVVDDMILGNALARAGVKVRMDAAHRLETPLKNHSLKKFLDYMERQILFPKFTNFGIWAAILTILGNTSLAQLASAALIVNAVVRTHWTAAAYGAVGFYLVMLLAAYACRRLHPDPPPFLAWLKGFLSCCFLTVWVCIRTIPRKSIFWHGREYVVGKGGRVREVVDVSDPARRS